MYSRYLGGALGDRPPEELAPFKLQVEQAAASAEKVAAAAIKKPPKDSSFDAADYANTVAALTARFEASSAEALEQIKSEFREQLARVAPDLELTF